MSYWENTSDDVKMITNEKVPMICLKKCINDYDEPNLSLAQKSCMSRCVFKFYDAIEVGYGMIDFLTYKVNAHNEIVQENVFNKAKQEKMI